MQKRKIDYLLIPLLACIWGSSFILMKKGMFTNSGAPVYSAAQVASIRISLAGFVFIPLFIRLYRKLRQKTDLFYFSIVGLGGNLIPAYLFTYAEKTLPSGIAGIMNSFTPIFTIIIGFLLFRSKVSFRQLLGTLIGFLGITWLILLNSHPNSGHFYIAPALAILLATALYGLSLNTIKHKLSYYNPIEIATGGFSLAFLPAFIGFFIFDTTYVLKHHPQALNSLIYILILGLIGTAFAVVLFNRIIAQTSALAASTVTYFIPIVAVGIGLWSGEKLIFEQFLAMLVIIGGVLLVNWKGKKATY